MENHHQYQFTSDLIPMQYELSRRLYKTKVLKVAKSRLMKKVKWQRKLTKKESWLTMKVDLSRKLHDEESWSTKKVDWWKKLIDEEIDRERKLIDFRLWGQTKGQKKLVL